MVNCLFECTQSSWIDGFIFCNCRSPMGLLSPKRPFFARPEFYPSPPKPYILPPYIQPLATTLAAQPASPNFTYSPPVVLYAGREYVDEYAEEGTSESSSNDNEGPSSNDLSSDSNLY